jgi:hypothetical protein
MLLPGGEFLSRDRWPRLEAFRLRQQLADSLVCCSRDSADPAAIDSLSECQLRPAHRVIDGCQLRARRWHRPVWHGFAELDAQCRDLRMLVGDRALGCSLIRERRQPFPLESRVRGDHGPLCDHPQRRGRRRRIYLALTDDKYPSTDDHQSVRLDYS